MTNGLISELEAVNAILAVTGDSPVQTLSEDYLNANLALSTLQRISRDIQTKGWYFNETLGVTFDKDTNNKVVLPANTLNVQLSGDGGSLTQRGLSIYDKANRTYIIEADVVGDLIEFLQWKELPAVARAAILHEARFEFYQEFFTGGERERDLSIKMESSRLALVKENVEAQDANLLNGSRVRNIAFSNRRR